jgi:hypothetical protein
VVRYSRCTRTVAYGLLRLGRVVPLLLICETTVEVVQCTRNRQASLQIRCLCNTNVGTRRPQRWMLIVVRTTDIGRRWGWEPELSIVGSIWWDNERCIQRRWDLLR